MNRSVIIKKEKRKKYFFPKIIHELCRIFLFLKKSIEISFLQTAPSLGLQYFKLKSLRYLIVEISD